MPYPPRGREPVAPAAGKGSAPAGVASQAAHSGGPGQPSGPTTGVCLRWLDAAATKGGGSRPDRGPSRAPSPPGRYGARDRNRRDGAPSGATRSKSRVNRRTGCAPWRAVPLACCGVETPAPGDLKGEQSSGAIRAAGTMEFASMKQLQHASPAPRPLYETARFAGGEGPGRYGNMPAVGESRDPKP
jgi:hypothetical protein